ncbi:MAG TPA: hypothetical protein VIH27_00625 [Nitrososphaerales archaeon]
MKESSIMFLHYATGILIAVLGGVHLATHSFLGVTGYLDSLSYGSVTGRYNDLLFSIVLELLLINVTYHGLNGFRIILAEFWNNNKWTRIVNWSTLSLGVIVIIYGTIIVVGKYFLI